MKKIICVYLIFSMNGMGEDELNAFFDQTVKQSAKRSKTEKQRSEASALLNRVSVPEMLQETQKEDARFGEEEEEEMIPAQRSVVEYIIEQPNNEKQRAEEKSLLLMPCPETVAGGYTEPAYSTEFSPAAQQQKERIRATERSVLSEQKISACRRNVLSEQKQKPLRSREKAQNKEEVKKLDPTQFAVTDTREKGQECRICNDNLPSDLEFRVTSKQPGKRKATKGGKGSKRSSNMTLAQFQFSDNIEKNDVISRQLDIIEKRRKRFPVKELKKMPVELVDEIFSYIDWSYKYCVQRSAVAVKRGDTLEKDFWQYVLVLPSYENERVSYNTRQKWELEAINQGKPQYYPEERPDVFWVTRSSWSGTKHQRPLNRHGQQERDRLNREPNAHLDYRGVYVKQVTEKGIYYC